MTYVRTFAEEQIAIEASHKPFTGSLHSDTHVAVCLAELVRQMCYWRACRRWRGEVTLERVKLNAGGYDRQGQYFGGGLPLYQVTFERSIEQDGGCSYHRVRARDRASLRDALERIFPNAKVGR